MEQYEFNKDDFLVESIPSDDVLEWVMYKHYAHRKPPISYAFGLFKLNYAGGVTSS